MKTLKWGCLIASGLFLSGCLYSHSGRSAVKTSSGNQGQLLQDCQDLSTRGDLISLRNQIKVDVERILDLTNQDNVPVHIPEIEKRSERIGVNVEALKSMLDAKWTIEKWPMEFIWQVPYAGESGEKPIKVSIEKVLLNGVERNDLKPAIQVKKMNEGLKIILPKISSSLEICELKQTLGVYLKVTYGSVLKISTHHRLILE